MDNTEIRLESFSRIRLELDSGGGPQIIQRTLVEGIWKGVEQRIATPSEEWRERRTGHIALALLLVSHRIQLAGEVSKQAAGTPLLLETPARGVAETLKFLLNDPPKWARESFGVSGFAGGTKKRPRTLLSEIYEHRSHSTGRHSIFLRDLREKPGLRLKPEQLEIVDGDRLVTSLADLVKVRRALEGAVETESASEKHLGDTKSTADARMPAEAGPGDLVSGSVLAEEPGSNVASSPSAHSVAFVSPTRRRWQAKHLWIALLFIAALVILLAMLARDQHVIPPPPPPPGEVVLVDEFDTPPDWSSQKPLLARTRINGKRDLISQGGPHWTNLVAVRMASHDQMELRIREVSQAGASSGRGNEYAFTGFWFDLPRSAGVLTEVIVEISGVALASGSRRFTPQLCLELKKQGDSTAIRRFLLRSFLSSQGGFSDKVAVPADASFQFDRVAIFVDQVVADDAITFDRVSFRLHPP